MAEIFAIDLGAKVKCAVTGFKGIVTARIEYDSGCRRYQVTPKSVKNKKSESEFIDEIHLLASVKKPKEVKKRPGGYHPDPPDRDRP